MKANTLYKFIFPDVYVGNSAYYLDLFECGEDDCVRSDIFIECGTHDI